MNPQWTRQLPSPLDIGKMGQILAELDEGQRACVRSCLQCWQVPPLLSPPFRGCLTPKCVGKRVMCDSCAFPCTVTRIRLQDRRLDEEDLLMQMKTLSGKSPTLGGLFRKSCIQAARTTEVASEDDMFELMSLFADVKLLQQSIESRPKSRPVSRSNSVCSGRSPVRSPNRSPCRSPDPPGSPIDAGHFCGSPVFRAPSCNTEMPGSKLSSDDLRSSAKRPRARVRRGHCPRSRICKARVVCDGASAGQRCEGPKAR